MSCLHVVLLEVKLTQVQGLPKTGTSGIFKSQTYRTEVLTVCLLELKSCGTSTGSSAVSAPAGATALVSCDSLYLLSVSPILGAVVCPMISIL